MRRQFQPLFFMFLGLAIFGFLWQLFTDTQRLLYDILFLALVILIGWGIYRYVIKRNQTTFRGYRYPPTKGSNAKSPFTFSHPSVKKPKGNVKKKSKTHPFTVIEGNKGNKGKRKV